MRLRRTVDDRSLRPVRWPGRPGRTTLLRLGLVAALLGLAAAVLDSPPGCPAPPDRPGRAEADRPGPVEAGGPADGDPEGVGSANGDPGAVGSAGEPVGVPGPGGRAAVGRALPLPAGTVGVPVRLAEPAALTVLRPGNRVDLLAVPAGTADGGATLIEPRVLVLDVVGADDLDGRWALYLALRPEPARRAVGLPEGSRFAVVVVPG